MKDTIYLVFDKRKVVRANVKFPPNLGTGEHYVILNVEVPDAFFRTAHPTATLTIPESYIVNAPVIAIEAAVPEPDVNEKCVACGHLRDSHYLEGGGCALGMCDCQAFLPLTVDMCQRIDPLLSMKLDGR